MTADRPRRPTSRPTGVRRHRPRGRPARRPPGPARSPSARGGAPDRQSSKLLTVRAALSTQWNSLPSGLQAEPVRESDRIAHAAQPVRAEREQPPARRRAERATGAEPQPPVRIDRAVVELLAVAQRDLREQHDRLGRRCARRRRPRRTARRGRPKAPRRAPRPARPGRPPSLAAPPRPASPAARRSTSTSTRAPGDDPQHDARGGVPDGTLRDARAGRIARSSSTRTVAASRGSRTWRTPPPSASRRSATRTSPSPATLFEGQPQHRLLEPARHDDDGRRGRRRSGRPGRRARRRARRHPPTSTTSSRPAESSGIRPLTKVGRPILLDLDRVTRVVDRRRRHGRR